MSKLWQMTGDPGDQFHAGPKATRDISDILRLSGVEDFRVIRPRNRFVSNRQLRRLIWLLKCQVLRWKLPKNDVLFLSYPNEGYSASPVLSVLTPCVKRRKNLRLITIVTDLQSFHWAESVAAHSAENFLRHRLDAHEARLFEMSDKVVVHNPMMKDLLVSCGVDSGKILSLGIFDYLTNSDFPDVDLLNYKCVAYAGNLSKRKSPFVYALSKVSGCEFRLFGPAYEGPTEEDNVRHVGVFPPEQLPAHLNAGFGLVWDGPSVDQCAGPIGEYYKFISPHKLSLYLASGLPVFIWRECGEASFVVDNHLGFAVRSLYEIKGILDRLSFDDYAKLRANVQVMATRLRAGFYTKRAFSSLGFAYVN